MGLLLSQVIEARPEGLPGHRVRIESTL
jgi:hypothetical protein